eukprot:3817699-Lingulodinium_polyedra.AAC.1
MATSVGSGGAGASVCAGDAATSAGSGAASAFDAAAGPARQRRQPGRRDLDEKVQRALDLHF